MAMLNNQRVYGTYSDILTFYSDILSGIHTEVPTRYKAYIRLV